MADGNESLSLKLTDANPFEALGSLMAEIASTTISGSNSRRLYETTMRGHELDPIEVREDAISLFRDCASILRLPFLPEHQDAIESHYKYLHDLRETFYPMVSTIESISPYQSFVSLWDQDRWTILSLSVKSFRLMLHNYEVVELVTNYLSALRELLIDADKSQSGIEALEILLNLLQSIDEDLWKTSWEDFTDRFARLSLLLQAESEANSDSPLSSFIRATRDVMWKVFDRANRAADVLLFLPRAQATITIALSAASGALSPENRQLVEDFLSLMNQTVFPSLESGEIAGDRNALPEAPISDDNE